MGESNHSTNQECTAAEAEMNRNPTQGCAAVAYQYADICIPVQVKPNAVIGEIRTECCGKPIINCKENLLRKSCEVTIEQKIRIRVPIKYSASAQVGCVDINCCEE